MSDSIDRTAVLNATPRATPEGDAVAGSTPARRGRPLEMSAAAVLERIHQLASREAGLFRTHQTHSALYARARRLFGSWARAVAAAGVDYSTTIESARRRSLDTRRRLRRKRRVAR